MKTFHLDSNLRLPKPLYEVFTFFADAYNLEEITPSFLGFEVLTPRPVPMKVGQIIDYKLRLRGLPVRWRSEITAWDPPFRFIDEQRKGPYKLWIHEHRFTELDGMTLCEDHVEYAVPGGSIVNTLFVEKDVKAIFDFRRRKLAEIFGCGCDDEVAA